jgi:hypothetical protein
MMNTPQLAAPFSGIAIFDTARRAARSFIGAQNNLLAHVFFSKSSGIDGYARMIL